MPAPVKRLSDAVMPVREVAAADVDPHLTALATGDFVIGYDDASTTINALGARLHADGSFGTLLIPSFSAVSNDTSQSGYGLTDGTIAMVWFMGGGHMIADYNLGNLSGYSLLGVGDFNGDHSSDMVWRNNMSAVTETWLMQQGARVGGSTLGNLAGYQLLDTGDLNHDGTDDLVWRASNGNTSSWAMHDGQFHNDEQLLGNFAQTFALGGSGDFTGDGGKDVLLLNAGSNTTSILDIEHHSLVASDFLIS